MNEETTTPEAKEPTWEESHPWLSKLTARDEEDYVDEVIRYTLDEIRFA